MYYMYNEIVKFRTHISCYAEDGLKIASHLSRQMQRFGSLHSRPAALIIFLIIIMANKIYALGIIFCNNFV